MVAYSVRGGSGDIEKFEKVHKLLDQYLDDKLAGLWFRTYLTFEEAVEKAAHKRAREHLGVDSVVNRRYFPKTDSRPNNFGIENFRPQPNYNFGITDYRQPKFRLVSSPAE